MHKDLRGSIKNGSSSTKTFNPCLSKLFCLLTKLARAPGLQAKEETTEEGAAAIETVGPEAFFSYPSTQPPLSFHAASYGSCPLGPLLLHFVVMRRLALLSRGAERDTRAPCPSACWCPRWFLQTVAAGSWCSSLLGDSGADQLLPSLGPSFRAQTPLKCSAFWNSGISVHLIFFSPW